MKRTTVLIAPEHVQALERIARKRGVSKSEALREAIVRYAETIAPATKSLPRFAGCATSRLKGSLGRQARVLLDRGSTRKGWR